MRIAGTSYSPNRIFLLVFMVLQSRIFRGLRRLGRGRGARFQYPTLTKRPRGGTSEVFDRNGWLDNDRAWIAHRVPQCSSNLVTVHVQKLIFGDLGNS